MSKAADIRVLPQASTLLSFRMSGIDSGPHYTIHNKHFNTVIDLAILTELEGVSYWMDPNHGIY